jgi:hypothetical protein
MAVCGRLRAALAGRRAEQLLGFVSHGATSMDRTPRPRRWVRSGKTSPDPQPRAPERSGAKPVLGSFGETPSTAAEARRIRADHPGPHWLRSAPRAVGSFGDGAAESGVGRLVRGIGFVRGIRARTRSRAISNRGVRNWCWVRSGIPLRRRSRPSRGPGLPRVPRGFVWSTTRDGFVPPTVLGSFRGHCWLRFASGLGFVLPNAMHQSSPGFVPPRARCVASWHTPGDVRRAPLRLSPSVGPRRPSRG